MDEDCCPFCQRKTRTIPGFYWHFIFRHAFRKELRNFNDQDEEPLPPMPP